MITLTPEQRAAKVQRITSMLLKADPAKNDNEHERGLFRAQADKLMEQYGISEEECQPQERRSAATDWSTFFQDMMRRAREQQAREEEESRRQREAWERQRREKEYANERAKQHFLKRMVQLLGERGKVFVSDEFLQSTGMGIHRIQEEYLQGWDTTSDYDFMRNGFWIKVPTYQEEPQSQARWNQDAFTGQASQPIFDEFGAFMDGQRKTFDHSNCPHEKTSAARAKCRRDRQRFGY